MNKYHIKQVAFDKNKCPDLGKISKSVEVQGHHPGQAYKNYLSIIGEEFTTIQRDDIGTSDNPCVRFISLNKKTHEKFLFYINKQL
jgi:hypothetical protein